MIGDRMTRIDRAFDRLMDRHPQVETHHAAIARTGQLIGIGLIVYGLALAVQL